MFFEPKIASSLSLRILFSFKRQNLGGSWVEVRAVNINSVRYADDTVLVADSSEKLQVLLSVVLQANEVRGLSVNLENTKVMVASIKAEIPRVRILNSGVPLEQV